ncbi:MAG: DUF2971 domain-containing protein [Paenibacillaceae bacterium]|nr:DUF2971 domain-containing protein [Paenibacillaceae bacterium]
MINEKKKLKEIYAKKVIESQEIDRYTLKQIKPQSIFVYRSGNKDDLNALEGNNVWMCDPEKFNDPFECSLDIDLKHLIETGLKYDMHLKDIYCRNPFVIDELEQDENFLLYQERLSNRFMEIKHSFYIKCFSSNNQSIPMWGYYADSHKGFCIEYDFDEVFKMYGDYMFPVLYKKRFDTATAIINDDDAITNEWLLSCITKSEQWEHEDEWRLLMPKIFAPGINKTADGGLLPMPQPKTVYLGCKISRELEERARACTSCKIIKGKEDKTEYKLLFS